MRHSICATTNCSVQLAQPAKSGEKFEVEMKYEGKPTSGLYFILPDKDDPNRAKEIWTQGEAEDTHHYIPIYDYPNDRTTSEMILTVPADWLTVSNGKLLSVQDAPNGQKTWTWRQSLPVSTYLISFVAGRIHEKKDTLAQHSGHLQRAARQGRHDRRHVSATPRKCWIFSPSDSAWPIRGSNTRKRPWMTSWPSGMENVSATTLATRDMVHAELAGEKPEARGQPDLPRNDAPVVRRSGDVQGLDQHLAERRLCHVWRDPVGRALLRRGCCGVTATGASRTRWMQSRELYPIPIVTRDIDDSVEYAGNVYDKAGWVIQMLREQMGDDAFFRALKHYLETNRLQNVVTADLVKAYRGIIGNERRPVLRPVDLRRRRAALHGAFQLRRDAEESQPERQADAKSWKGRVGLFHVPVQLRLPRRAARNYFPIEVSKADETFSFPLDGPPLMVLFDKGDKILKSVDFQKSPEEWMRQLQTRSDVPDRADAAFALGNLRDNDAAVEALGDAAQHDKFWGVREEASARAGAHQFTGGAKTGAGRAFQRAALGARGRRRAVGQNIAATKKSSSACKISIRTIKPIPCAAPRCNRWRWTRLPTPKRLSKKRLTISSPDDVLRERRASRHGFARRRLRSFRRCSNGPLPGKPADLRGVAIGVAWPSGFEKS